MSGTLTSDLNYFSELAILNLYFNDLTGPIPDLSSLITKTIGDGWISDLSQLKSLEPYADDRGFCADFSEVASASYHWGR